MQYLTTTKKNFEKIFRREYLPMIRREESRGIDYPLRRESWNNLIDALVKDGDLPGKANDWVCPW